MAELPTGTVTFLFTDIEGSTRLLTKLGDEYADVLARHSLILREAIEEGGGVEVSTEGDSFFVVFPDASGAVRAAVAAQRKLSAQEWPAGLEVRVRIGVHTGQGMLGGENYVGIDVNRASRIANAACGGQVIVSEATHGLVEHSLPEGTSLRDLGEHRLKDMIHPERLHDLVVEGTVSDFPPPRTLDSRPNNLPVQLTSFVGREQERAEIRELLGRTRMLTLTGTGGSGKTRLAIQVAHDTFTEYRDGAFFVDLSSVTDPALVPSAIAEALRVQEVPGQPILDAVIEHLRDRELLLVLDNFEQVVDAATSVEKLLTDAAKIKVLVTSRFVLSVAGEQEYEVPPMEPPDLDELPDLATLRRIDAVRLFTDRATAASPRFKVTEENAGAIAAITSRLDGLPLAVELAATRTKLLTPEQILPRLEQSLSLLTSGARSLPERQRTLRGAIAWSHDLLEEPERRLLARLSVFAGGWTLEAAEALCDAKTIGMDIIEGLASLVDKSLVRRTDPGPDEARFSMLETIREFAHEQLTGSGELGSAREQHAHHYLRFASEAEPHLTADDQGEWLDRCELEHPNIRAALAWAVETGKAEAAQAAAGALWRFWQQRGHLAEARKWFDRVLAMPSGRDAARAKALTGSGGVAWWQMDRSTARRCYEEALEIERELGDPGMTGEALYNVAFAVAADEDIEGAAKLFEESIEMFRKAGDDAGVAKALVTLVIREAEAGQWDVVIARLEEGITLLRGLGERYQMANSLVWLATAYFRAERKEDAHRAGLEALEIFGEVDNTTGIALALLTLAFLALWEERYEDAIKLSAGSERLDESVGAERTQGFAGLLEGDPGEEAASHLPEDTAARARERGRAMSMEELVALARVAG
jgi:predicted ATPase/class 3 adenylate cyclase